MCGEQTFIGRAVVMVSLLQRVRNCRFVIIINYKQTEFSHVVIPTVARLYLPGLEFEYSRPLVGRLLGEIFHS